METWEFYDITHRDHLVCNPTSIEKLQRVIDLLDLPPEPRVLDIACGKGSCSCAPVSATAVATGSRSMPPVSRSHRSTSASFARRPLAGCLPRT